MFNKIKTLLSLYNWAKNYPSKDCSSLYILKDYIPRMIGRALRPGEYQKFEFDRRSDDFKDSYLGTDERLYYLNLLNPLLYHCCARNKYITHKMFEDTGITTSDLYCYYQPESTIVEGTEGVIACSVSQVIDVLKKQNVSSCVLKLTDSAHGNGVVVIKGLEYGEDDAVAELFDGKRVKLSELLADRPSIIEGLISQSKQMSSFNESSVNTIRIMTALYPDGNVKVFAAFLKIGRRGKMVDNAGIGGNVDAGIDIKTGTIYNGYQFDGWGKVKSIECHPDSGTQLKGNSIENWEEILQFAINAQKAFPYCRASGWDIAVTETGPMVIEINDLWDTTGQYFTDFGWRDAVRDCYSAWIKAGENTHGAFLKKDRFNASIKTNEKDHSLSLRKMPNSTLKNISECL